MGNKKYQIILADDHDILLDSVEKLITKEPDLSVIAKVNSGYELMRQIDVSFPDLCIVDLDMPGMNGLVATEKLLGLHPGLKIMILSMHTEKSIVKKLMQMGIKAYLTKTSDREELLHAIRQVLKGQEYFSDKILSQQNLSKIEADKQTEIRDISFLSDREMEIAALICDGLTNKQIAEKINLSPKTVDNHRTNMMRKLDVHNVVELIRVCLKHGIC